MCVLWLEDFQIRILWKENWKERRDDVGALTVLLVDIGITTVYIPSVYFHILVVYDSKMGR